MIEDLENDTRRAFNIVTHDSILVFQFSAQLIPCACQIRKSEECDMSTAILNAYNEIMDEYLPDNRKLALVIGGGAEQAELAASVLIGEEYCKKVLVLSNEEAFLRQYCFLIGVKMADFPNYPSEITESLYLGGIGNLNQEALSHLGVSAVVSAIHHPVQPPPCVSDHVLFSLEDECNADIARFFNGAIAFISAAHTRGQKVFVHCHQGVSRSASILIAYMVHAGIASGVTDALQMIRVHRPHVRPNPAFMSQLLSWEEDRARNGCAAYRL